jgi:hypothetical protein
MTYTKPRHCIFCGDPESLCQCGPEILEFAAAHIVPTDDGCGVVAGETLRVLVERAQAYGREVLSPAPESRAIEILREIKGGIPPWLNERRLIDEFLASLDAASSEPR